MVDKRVNTLAQAVQGIHDGAVLMVGGFGTSGRPVALLGGVLELGVRDLTIIANNAIFDWNVQIAAKEYSLAFEF